MVHHLLVTDDPYGPHVFSSKSKNTQNHITQKVPTEATPCSPETWAQVLMTFFISLEASSKEKYRLVGGN